MTNDAKDREVIVPEPKDGRWRTAIPIVGVLWIVLHLAIPSSYYRDGADVYDERFAWRMFSSVRVRQCQVRVTEQAEGGARDVSLMEILPAPWVALLERSRPAVVEGFLRWRCEREGTREIQLRTTCIDATGDALAPTERTMECATGEVRDASLEAAR